jgi:hypothetical protein
MTTFVADAILIGVDVLNGICGIVEVVNEEVIVALGNGVPVVNEAPGVRKRLTQTGSVRMEGSTGSMNPLGLRVRKSLFGLRLESISAFSFQLEEKRNAHCPATITHKNPIKRMIGTMSQSRRSCSMAFIGKSMEWQSHKDRRAGIRRFVVTRTLKPDTSMMSIHDAACNGKPEAGSPSLEFCFS